MNETKGILLFARLIKKTKLSICSGFPSFVDFIFFKRRRFNLPTYLEKLTNLNLENGGKMMDIKEKSIDIMTN